MRLDSGRAHGGEGRRGASRRRLLLTVAATALTLTPGLQARADDARPDPWLAGQLAQAEQVRTFDIPAQQLSDALAAFGQQADLQVAVDSALVSGRESPGVQGSYTPRQALERLLAGTDLAYRFPEAATVTLSRAADPGNPGPVRLAPVDVTGTLVGTRVGETAAESSASVDLYDENDLEERPDTREVRDLYEKSPNVVDFGESNLGPAIRGVDSTGPAEGGLGFISGLRPRATLSVDGRPRSSGEYIGGATGLWDVEQVEVYRGPQTTLQGRNSIAGAFVVETRDPTFFWEGAARDSAGTENRNRQSAMISGPLVEDTLAVRLTADRFDGESFVDYTGPQEVDDVEEDR